MTQRNGTIPEAALHGFADDRLSADERAEVAAYLADHPDQAIRVEAWRRQTQELRKAFEPVIREPVPAALVTTAMGGSRTMSWRVAWAAAASIVLLLAGGLSGWVVRDSSEPPQPSAQVETFVQRAAFAHVVYEPEVKHPVEVGASQLDHLVEWLSKRLGTKVSAPVLTSAGYQLIGGRLLPGVSTPAAQFMYQDKDGRRITLYLRVDTKKKHDTAFLWHQQGDLLTCYWLDGTIGYALTGRIPWKDMEKLSKLVYDQIG